ncbi:unnamed protein product [Phytophthora fragariaefolia]|uniref:Unnamed protein product n=1 Tax=Phytophthora fragariaefolia TaxID=1490495 RepID=A0A9W6TWT0_9STRA|nr:unnamed protein product [Phytophthora fragariaefolia]
MWLSTQNNECLRIGEHQVQLLRIDSSYKTRSDDAKIVLNSKLKSNFSSAPLTGFNIDARVNGQDEDLAASGSTAITDSTGGSTSSAPLDYAKGTMTNTSMTVDQPPPPASTHAPIQSDFVNEDTTANIPVAEAIPQPPTTSMSDNGLISDNLATVPTTSQWSCLGWKQTGGCSPDGPREVENDASCSTKLQAGLSGYCLLRNEATGEEVHAMRSSCSSLLSGVEFNCNQAVGFMQMTSQLNSLVDSTTTEQWAAQATDHQEVAARPMNGVLMVMYPNLLLSIYGTIRVLRSYNCSLPIELWFLESEMGTKPLVESQLIRSLVTEYGPISLHGIASSNVVGFNTKIYALSQSKLDQVLYLDSDNTPVKDPTYLFTTPEFVDSGAIFWPDFWQPVNTIFNINEETLLWEYVGIRYVNMFEQESGQLLIDLRRAAAALKVLQLFAFQEPNLFQELKLVHGDKDLYRLAWLKTNTPFHMIETPAAAAGMMNGDQFCGITMVQHDSEGEILFLHHNGKKVINDGQARIWTQLQSFVFPGHLALHRGTTFDRKAYLGDTYRVGIDGSSNLFPGLPMCYRLTSVQFQFTPWSGLAFHDLEARLQDFAQQASELENDP